MASKFTAPADRSRPPCVEQPRYEVQTPRRTPRPRCSQNNQPASPATRLFSADRSAVPLTLGALQQQVQAVEEKFTCNLRNACNDIQRRMSQIQNAQDDFSQKVFGTLSSTDRPLAEMQVRVLCSKAMDSKLEDFRCHMLEDLRENGRKMEQKHQKITTQIRVAFAAVEEQRESQNQCVKAFGRLLEDHLQEWGRRDEEATRTLVHLNERLAMLENDRLTSLTASLHAENATEDVRDLRAEINAQAEKLKCMYCRFEGPDRDHAGLALHSEQEQKLQELPQHVAHHIFRKAENKYPSLSPMGIALSEPIDTLTRGCMSRKELYQKMQEELKTVNAKLEGLFRHRYTASPVLLHEVPHKELEPHPST